MKAIKQFLLGIQFLTRIPITGQLPCEQKDFRGAMTYFTLIGLLIGGIQYSVYFLGLKLLNPMFASVLGTLAGIYITGGMHLDGLADVSDGFFAQRDKEKTLEIMKDSRIGSFGVIALIIDFFIHFAGFYSLRHAPYLYLLVPVGAKMAVCFMCYKGQVIQKGLGSLWINNIGKFSLVFNIGVMLVLSYVLLGVLESALLILLITGVTWYLLNKMTKKLDGINGDCLGTCSQVIEWVILIYLVASLKR